MNSGTDRRRLRAEIRGTVQGVGFRPYVYALAHRHGLAGWVANSNAGVILEIEGIGRAIDDFVATLPHEAPPHAHIDRLDLQEMPPRGQASFEIRESLRGGNEVTIVLPDLATCPECLAELLDPANRRYRYPFINCTHCGPRFSIIEDLPYDRGRTGMRDFPLCPDCAGEYQDPADRRFHAEPVACPACGPQLALWDQQGQILARGEAALLAAIEAVGRGGILAVKGLGGFHLMADAADETAVAALRRRKARPHKAFALMFPDLSSIGDFCAVGAIEAGLLTGPAAPIVLLRRKSGRLTDLAPSLAPDSPFLGCMLPYTPLHHLMMRALGRPLVATSGNRSDEPIVTDEGEVALRLAGIADLYLVHDRPIVRALDDSVVRVVAGRPMMLRRARGYAPLPIESPRHADAPAVLALGGHLKATTTLAVRGHCFVSQHLGDTETLQSCLAHAAAIEDLPRLLAARPVLVAHDPHPDYASTETAHALGLPRIAVQHHLAHIVAAMAENGLAGTVLGIAWDGTGWGGDGTVWGGEALMVKGKSWKRVAHLRHFPLPGGEAAVKEPRRAALGLLFALGGLDGDPFGHQALAAFDDAERTLLAAALAKGINCPPTSSAGRLFDAVAALLGLRQTTSHEGEAAMLLEALAMRSADRGAYPFDLVAADQADSCPILDWEPLIRAILTDLDAGIARQDIAARFHNGLAAGILAIARRFAEGPVVLAGGCFQNALLLEGAVARLKEAGYESYWNVDLPPNDGGLSFGQAIWALDSMMDEGS